MGFWGLKAKGLWIILELNEASPTYHYDRSHFSAFSRRFQQRCTGWLSRPNKRCL